MHEIRPDAVDGRKERKRKRRGRGEQQKRRGRSCLYGAQRGRFKTSGADAGSAPDRKRQAPFPEVDSPLDSLLYIIVLVEI